MLVLAPAPSTWPLHAGSSVESERGTAADIVLHVVYLAGLFTFAIVLGVVTDDIGNAFDKV